MRKSKPADLSDMRILVTNDDGIHAPGLKVLEHIARSLTRDVWVVAPEEEQSGASHSLTLRRPLQVRKISPRRFAVNGTPTDCVLLAAGHIIEGKRPDLVLSGVNRGANLGEDVTYSGTIAAAMEATLLGLPAIAMSQGRNGEIVHYQTAERAGPDLVRRLYQAGWPTGTLINVNFPHSLSGKTPKVKVVTQGRREGPIVISPIKDPRGRSYLWIGDYANDHPATQGTDLSAIADGHIAITPLHLDLTHRQSLRHLKDLFS